MPTTIEAALRAPPSHLALTGGTAAIHAVQGRLNHRATSNELAGHFQHAMALAIAMGPPLDAPEFLPAGGVTQHNWSNSAGRAWPAPARVRR